MSNTYIFDSEDGAEMTRLILLDRVMTTAMGGPLAGLPALPEEARVLDLCCGPGGWVLDVAYTRPDIAVTGMDISQTMIAYAQARAMTQRLTNATFVVGDILRPWDFPDQTFDLVNARFLIAALPRAAWREMVQACFRVTKPGGVIRLTESDVFGLTSSRAFADWSQLCYQLSSARGYGFSPDQRSLGITHLLGDFLQTVGCEPLLSQMHVVDFSAHSEGWADIFHNYNIAFTKTQPLLQQAGLATQQELEALYQHFLIESHLASFRGVWPSMSVWGTKPLNERPEEGCWEVEPANERGSQR